MQSNWSPSVNSSTGCGPVHRLSLVAVSFGAHSWLSHFASLSRLCLASLLRVKEPRLERWVEDPLRLLCSFRGYSLCPGLFCCLFITAPAPENSVLPELHRAPHWSMGSALDPLCSTELVFGGTEDSKLLILSACCSTVTAQGCWL